MSDLKTWREQMAVPYITHSNGLCMIESVGEFGLRYTQCESEAAARFFVAAHREVPTLFARIEELEKCSDPLLVNNLHADVLRLERERVVLADRVKALEDQVAIEVNLRTKAQGKARKALGFAAKALDQARDNEKLRAELAATQAELAKERELRAAADKALEALESINEQVGPYIDQLADALRKAVKVGLDSIEVIEEELPDVQEEDEANGIENSTRGQLLALLQVIK